MNQGPNLLIENHEQTCVIKMNRPKVYNALTVKAKQDLLQNIQEASQNNSIRSIILTGEGSAFCTGQDLNDRTVQASHGTIDLGKTLEEEWNPIVRAMRESPKIIIGAINGVCAGAGLSLAMSTDLVIAKTNTKFISGFSKLGLCPDAGLTSIFTRALGPKKAMEFFLLNRPYLAHELLTLGLVNEVADDVLMTALELSQKINGMAPMAVSTIKRNTQLALDTDFNQMLKIEEKAQQILGRSQDYNEGLNAFFSKRTPEFKGQ